MQQTSDQHVFSEHMLIRQRTYVIINVINAINMCQPHNEHMNKYT